MQAARELETERRRAEALSAEQQAARQQLAAMRAEVGALKQQRGQRQEQQQAAAEVRPQSAFRACASSRSQQDTLEPLKCVSGRALL